MGLVSYCVSRGIVYNNYFIGVYSDMKKKLQKQKGIDAKAIINFYYNGDMDGCWMRNSKTS